DSYVIERAQYPTSRVMTHGIIHDRYVFLGGAQEPIESWANGVLAHLAPGMALQELYIDPAMVPDEQARFLAGALRWMDANEDILFSWGEMIGGDPRTGAVYGFSHGGTLLFLRNPSPHSQSYTVPVAAPMRVRTLYPFLGLEQSAAIELEPYEVRVISIV